MAKCECVCVCVCVPVVDVLELTGGRLALRHMSMVEVFCR